MHLTYTILLAGLQGTVKKPFRDSQGKGGWIWEWQQSFLQFIPTIRDDWLLMCECCLNPIRTPIRPRTNFSLRHDDVLENMGLSGPSFVDKNEDQVTEMKRSLLEFMKAARANLNRRDENEATGPGSGSDDDGFQVKMTVAGFPILPNIEDRTLSKVVYEKLLRTYLSQHYCECLYYFSPGSILNHIRQIWRPSKKPGRFHTLQLVKTSTHSFLLNTCLVRQPFKIHETCAWMQSKKYCSIGFSGKKRPGPSQPSGLQWS